MASKVTGVSSNHLASIDDVRRYIKNDLAAELEKHARVQRDEMNEATYVAIAWEAIQRRVGPKFRVETDRSVPGTSYRADIVLYRDKRTGVIAIEAKANRRASGLIGDLQKLRECIDTCPEVNCGVLIYFSSGEAGDVVDRELRNIKARSSTMDRKLAMVRVKVPRNRISWGSDES